MKIICISGKAFSGKDATATIFKKLLEEENKKVLIIHNADFLKFICRQFFGWDGNKDEKGRKLLQYVGTDVVRSKNPDFWIDHIIEILDMFQNEWDYVLIPDCRFPNEILKLRLMTSNKIYTVRVERPNFESPLTDEQKKHPSETSLDKFKFMYIVENDKGFRELEQKVISLIDDIEGR